MVELRNRLFDLDTILSVAYYCFSCSESFCGFSLRTYWGGGEVDGKTTVFMRKIRNPMWKNFHNISTLNILHSWTTNLGGYTANEGISGFHLHYWEIKQPQLSFLCNVCKKCLQTYLLSQLSIIFSLVSKVGNSWKGQKWKFSQTFFSSPKQTPKWLHSSNIKTPFNLKRMYSTPEELGGLLRVCMFWVRPPFSLKI